MSSAGQATRALIHMMRRDVRVLDNPMLCTDGNKAHAKLMLGIRDAG